MQLEKAKRNSLLDVEQREHVTTKVTMYLYVIMLLKNQVLKVNYIHHGQSICSIVKDEILEYVKEDTRT